MDETISSTDPGRGVAFGGWAAGDVPRAAGRKGQVRFTTPGPGTWTPPAGVTQVYVECIGGGAGGSGGEALTNGGGGGGGAYAAALYTVTPGVPVTYYVGVGSPAAEGGVTADNGDWSAVGVAPNIWESDVAAEGGQGGNPNAAAFGGSAANSTGTVKYDGGGGTAPADEFTAGAGGGAAGRTGAGGTSTDFNGGPGIRPGGNGGSGATNNSVATVGGVGGGGGGGVGVGAYTAASAGGDGIVIISWGYIP